MRPRDIVELVALAALWGGSFLFMRVAVPAFGPVALAALRVGGAAALLVPLLVTRGQWPALRRHWRPIAIVGLANSAVPFLCFAYAAQSINAGAAAIFNSATPLFAAVIAWLWLGDRLSPLRGTGLAIGFAGVVWVALSRAGFSTGASPWPIAACLTATLCYGVSPSLTKRHLGGVPPLAVAAGSQLAAALLLVVPAALTWPAVPPAPFAWFHAGVLAIACTGLAYILYFRLIANAGPANAVAVTYLVPIFAVLWAGLFLGERLTPPLIVGCAVIFLGTALATGILAPGRRAALTTSAAPSLEPPRPRP